MSSVEGIVRRSGGGGAKLLDAGWGVGIDEYSCECLTSFGKYEDVLAGGEAGTGESRISLLPGIRDAPVTSVTH